MSARRSDEFIADVEKQYEWYAANAGFEIADRYLDAVQATCRLLSQQPHLGPAGGFNHSQLLDWRFFLVFRPFDKHIVFYEIIEDALIMRRTMHGQRNIPKRLL